MSEVATFFRHPSKHSGLTYHIEIGSSRLSAYSRKPIQPQLLKQVADRKEVSIAETELRNAINKQGAGGVVVTATDERGESNVGIEWVGTKDEYQFVVLSPGRPPRFSRNKERLPAGSHVIVPVDGDAEESLNQFIGHLAWLSPDLESLVLNTLRRPSLDARLDKVEKTVFGRTSDEALNAGRFKRMMIAARRWTSSRAYGVAAVVLALLLGTNAFFLSRMYSKVDKPSAAATIGEGPTSSPPDQPDPIKETLPALTGEQVFVDDAKELFKLLREKRASDPALDTLYKVHFTEFDKALTDEQVANAFRKGNRAPLWGVIKLQGLKFEPSPGDQKFLTGSDEITATKALFNEIGPDKIENDPEGLRLLAAIACRLGYETPKAPGLPEIKSGPALEFVPGGDCTTFTAADIEKGLKGLIEFVKQRP